MSFRIGIIGSGGIGKVHAESAVAAGQAIAGFCDVKLPRAQRLAAGFAGAMATSSVDELLALPDMQAVVVSAPNHRHKELALAALRAGKHVLLEKPMAMSVDECDEIIAAHKASKRHLQMNFVSRQSPASLAAADFVRGGRLGKIYHVKAWMCRRRGIPGLGRWFTNKAESGGGVLIDLGVHLIDLALHMTGRPKLQRASAVCSSTFGRRIDDYAFTEMWAGPPHKEGVNDVEDSATALLRFDSGLTMELNVMWAANIPDNLLPNGMMMLGDAGGCFLEMWGRRITLTTQIDGHVVDAAPDLPPGEPWPLAWKRQHELFGRTVEHGEPPVATAQHGREVQAIIEALYRSAREGREVEFADQ
jgi:predicted dehydrogenase